jgi:hypothetical protein
LGGLHKTGAGIEPALLAQGNLVNSKNHDLVAIYLFPSVKHNVLYVLQ